MLSPSALFISGACLHKSFQQPGQIIVCQCKKNLLIRKSTQQQNCFIFILFFLLPDSSNLSQLWHFQGHILAKSQTNITGFLLLSAKYFKCSLSLFLSYLPKRNYSFSTLVINHKAQILAIYE